MKSLHSATYRAILPYVNKFDPGRKLATYDSEGIPARGPDGHILFTPKHTIPKHYWNDPALKCRASYNIFSASHVKEMIEHRSTYYFTGGKEGRTLLYLDVDAHNGETDQDFTTQCLLDIFPDAFVNTSDRGTNLYLKVNYRSIADMNTTSKELETALREYLTARGCDCTFEIKGSITTQVKSGSLAKLPCYRVWDFDRLTAFVQKPEIEAAALKALIPEIARISQRCNNLSEVPEHLCHEDVFADIISKDVFQPAPPKRKRIKGSTTNFPLSADQLEMIPAKLADYKERAQHCYAFHVEPKGRAKLTVEDFQQALVVLAICAYHPNQNGTMPTARIIALWSFLYEQGYFSRGFDCHRWSAIRQTLNNLDYTEEVDRNYWHFHGEKPGQAAKWHLKTEHCVDFSITNTKTEDTSISVGTTLSPPVHDYVEARWDVEEIAPPGVFVIPEDVEALMALAFTQDSWQSEDHDDERRGLAQASANRIPSLGGASAGDCPLAQRFFPDH